MSDSAGAKFPRPICDCFVVRDGVEYIVEVYTQDEGVVEDCGVYILNDDGTKGDSVDPDRFFDDAQRGYVNWVDSLLDDGRDSYPASHY